MSNHCKLTGYRNFVIFMFIIAFVVAILGITLPMNYLNVIVAVNNFFTLMLPILGVAALVRYLITSPYHCNGQKQGRNETLGEIKDE